MDLKENAYLHELIGSRFPDLKIHNDKVIWVECPPQYTFEQADKARREINAAMQEQVIMPSKLNPGMISVLRFKYDDLTDEFIQRILVRLYCDDLIKPEYLFVNTKGRNDVSRALESLPEAAIFATTKPIRYPNKTTGEMMHVVVLPTLPDNMFLLGKLILPDWNEHGIWGEDTPVNPAPDKL